MSEFITRRGRTPIFTPETVPDALLRDHATKPGVSGRLHILSGTVTYFSSAVEESGGTPLRSGQIHVIPPAERHRVALSDDASFWIEFLNADGGVEDDIHD